MKIFLTTPSYNHTSAGIDVMHYLMYLLQLNGHRVHTSTSILNHAYPILPIPDTYNSSSYNLHIMPQLFVPGYPIVKPTMRWVLFYPGRCGDQKKYGPYEVCFHWHPKYETASKDASYFHTSELFNLPCLDKTEYEFPQVPRKGDLFFVYKGQNANTHPTTAAEITRKDPAARKDLLKLLRTHETLYTYDRDTRLSIEAHLMGMTVLEWDKEAVSWTPFSPAPEDIKFRDPEKDKLLIPPMLENFKLRSKF